MKPVWDQNTTLIQNKGKNVGTITTVSATMFGGKSVYALHVMESRSKAYRRIHGLDENVVLYINHSLDDRSDAPFSTHSDIISSAALDKINVNYKRAATLCSIGDEFISKHKVVFIDEAQFFPDLVNVVLHIAEDLGIDVYAMGLTLDYKRQTFGDLGYLSLLADEPITLRSTFCGFCAQNGEMKKAIYTHRITDATGEQVEIGSDNYIAVCRKCYVIHTE
jgi:thymidine kinase